MGKLSLLSLISYHPVWYGLLWVAGALASVPVLPICQSDALPITRKREGQGLHLCLQSALQALGA